MTMNLVPMSSIMEKIAGPKKPESTAKPPSMQPSGEALKKQKAREKATKTRQKNARAALKGALEKSKVKRLARTEKAKKADQEIARIKAEKPLSLSDVPAQVAHCMMALHVKRGKSKEAAWNICRWSLAKHGYLKGYNRNAKLPKATKQTGKGSTRSFQHGTEKGPLGGGVPGTGTSKFNRFTRMFRSLETKILKRRRRR